MQAAARHATSGMLIIGKSGTKSPTVIDPKTNIVRCAGLVERRQLWKLPPEILTAACLPSKHASDMTITKHIYSWSPLCTCEGRASSTFAHLKHAGSRTDKHIVR